MSAHIPQQPPELTDDEAIAQFWRRARFAAIVGALIGLGGCVLLVIGFSGLLLLLRSTGGSHLTTDDVVPLILRAAGFVVLGAAIGLMITGLTFTSRVTSVTGTGPESKRIRRAVFRDDPTPLSPEEQARAARYAPLGETMSRFQIVSIGALYVGILLQQIPQLFQDPTVAGFDLRPLTITTVGVLLLAYAVLLYLQIRGSARARRYIAAHGRTSDPS